MAEQLCCGRVIYKYSYRSKLKILYFPMMPLLSQTNFPDKHGCIPFGQTHPLENYEKRRGRDAIFIAFNAAFRLRDFRWWLCCHGGCFSH